MKKSGQQAGFTVVETLLLLIFVAIVGFVGYYVWHTQQTNDKNSTKVSTTAKTVDTKNDTSKTPIVGTKMIVTTLSKAPSALQSAVLTYQKTQNACVDSSGHLVNEAGALEDPAVSYVDNNAAFIPVCQSVSFYAFTNNKWTYINRTQFAFACAELKQYNVSPLLMQGEGSSQCLDANGNMTNYQ